MPRLFLSLALAALTALPAVAQTPPASPVQVAALSARLHAIGVETRDPVLVLAAARLRKSLAPAEDADRRAEGAERAAGAPLDWEEMAETAVALADGDDAILGLIEDLRAETTKGVVSGPVYNIGQLGPRKTDTYARIEFRGGEYAEVYVEARTAVDVNLQVLDAQGRLVCSDTDRSHIAYCGWRPAEAGAFTLQVENRGSVATGYALMTN